MQKTLLLVKYKEPIYGWLLTSVLSCAAVNNQHLNLTPHNNNCLLYRASVTWICFQHHHSKQSLHCTMYQQVLKTKDNTNCTLFFATKK